MKYIQENNLIRVICYKIILEHFCSVPKKNYFVFKNTMDLKKITSVLNACFFFTVLMKSILYVIFAKVSLRELINKL